MEVAQEFSSPKKGNHLGEITSSVLNASSPLPRGKQQGSENWITQQKKALTAWVNSKLDARVVQIQDGYVDTAFHDGIILIKLLESLSGKHLPRYDLRPKSRIHCFANLSLAFQFMEQEQLLVTGISAEDFADCNEKAILGFVWSLFKKYMEENSPTTGDRDLLKWCQEKAQDYGITINDFSASFQDGRAFCALVHSECPDHFDFDELKEEAAEENLRLAMDVAHKVWRIPALLDAADVALYGADSKSVQMYVTLLHNAFGDLASAREMQSSKLSLEEQLAKLKEELRISREAEEGASLERDHMRSLLAGEKTAHQASVANAKLQHKDLMKSAEELAVQISALSEDLIIVQHDLTEQVRTNQKLAELKTENDDQAQKASEMAEELIEENRQLRCEVEDLTAIEGHRQQTLQIAATEMRAMTFAKNKAEKNLKEETAMRNSRNAIVLNKLQAVYDHFSDPLALAKVAIGADNLRADRINGQHAGTMSLRVGKSGRFQRWQNRYVVLKDNFIVLFKDITSTSLQRVVRLDKARVSAATRPPNHLHCIKIETGDSRKNVLLETASAEIRDGWLEAFEEAATWWECPDKVADSLHTEATSRPLGVFCALMSAIPAQIGLPRGVHIGPDGPVRLNSDEVEAIVNITAVSNTSREASPHTPGVGVGHSNVSPRVNDWIEGMKKLDVPAAQEWSAVTQPNNSFLLSPQDGSGDPFAASASPVNHINSSVRSSSLPADGSLRQLAARTARRQRDHSTPGSPGRPVTPVQRDLQSPLPAASSFR